MARMPTRDNLPQAVPQTDKTIVRAPTSTIGQNLSALGVSLERTAQAEEKKQSAMELARARSHFQTSVLEGDNAYDLDKKPDYKGWADEADKGVRQWQRAAADGISNPRVQEKFLLETADDATRFKIRVGNRSQKIANREQIATTTAAMDQMAVNASNPDLTDDERADMRQDLGESMKGMVKSGLWTEGEATLKAIEYKRRIAKLRVMTDIQNDPIAADAAFGGYKTASISLIKKREGFLRSPKWDENAYRGGYGSDTVTLANGKVIPVTKGMKITRADAERDLNRRTLEFEKGLVKSVGADKWMNLNTNTRAALTSFVYNYGSLAKLPSLRAAIKTGDKEKIARAIEDRAGDNEGVNAQRRMEEAAIVRGEQGISGSAHYAELSAEDAVSLRAAASRAAATEFDRLDDVSLMEDSSQLATEAMEFETREEAYKYVRENAGDAEVKDKALAAVDVEMRRRDTEKQEARTNEWTEKYDTVSKGLEEGSHSKEARDAAMEVALSIDNPEDRQKMVDFVNKPTERDDPAVILMLDSLRYSSDPEDQKKFLEIDLTSPELLNGLTSARRQQLFQQQQASRTRSEPTGTDPVFTTVSQMRSTLANKMGLKISGAKADPEDVAVMEMISAQVQTALEGAYKAKGDTLTATDYQNISDGVVIDWYERTKINDSYYDDTVGTASQAVSKAYDNYKDETEDFTPLPVLYKQFNLALEAGNKQTGKKKAASPSGFAMWLQHKANQ